MPDRKLKLMSKLMRYGIAILAMAGTGFLNAQTGGYHQLDINPSSGSPGILVFNDTSTFTPAFTLKETATNTLSFIDSSSVTDLQLFLSVGGQGWQFVGPAATFTSTTDTGHPLIVNGHSITQSADLLQVLGYAGGPLDLRVESNGLTAALGGLTATAVSNSGKSMQIFGYGSGQSADLLDIYQYSGGSQYLNMAANGSTYFNGPFLAVNTQLQAWAGSSSTVPFIINGASGQTANLMNIENGGPILAFFDNVGHLTVPGCTGCGGGSPGSPTLSFQYNNSGSFAGATNLLYVSPHVAITNGAYLQFDPTSSTSLNMEIGAPTVNELDFLDSSAVIVMDLNLNVGGQGWQLVAPAATFQPTTDTGLGLTVKGHSSSQSGDLLQVLGYGGAPLDLKVTAAGLTAALGGLTATAVSNSGKSLQVFGFGSSQSADLFEIYQYSGGPQYLNMTNTGATYFNGPFLAVNTQLQAWAGSTSTVPLTVIGATGQTANLLDIETGSGSTVVAFFDNVGHLTVPGCTGCGTTPPGGSNSDVQINNTGAFYGDGYFTYNSTSHTASVLNLTVSGITGSTQCVQVNSSGLLSGSGGACGGGGGGGTPGGSTGSIQYNTGSAFGGFGAWNNSTSTLNLSGIVDFVATSTGTPTLTVEAVSSQSADVLHIENSSAAAIFTVAPSGNLLATGIDTLGEQVFVKTGTATSISGNLSPILGLDGSYWNGSFAIASQWLMEAQLSSGTSPTNTLKIFWNGGGTDGGVQFSDIVSALDFIATGTPSISCSGSCSVSSFSGSDAVGHFLLTSTSAASILYTTITFTQFAPTDWVCHIDAVNAPAQYVAQYPPYSQTTATLESLATFTNLQLTYECGMH
jgi:hypothetical protein